MQRVFIQRLLLFLASNFKLMLNRLLFIWCGLILTSLSLSAQNNYGNEWIYKNTKYIKITVNSEGIYKLSYNDIINSAIVNNSEINPKHFQLFNKGKEIPLIISGTEDNKFDTADIIYFYGTHNDADLDRSMYANQNFIPNSNVGLYEDENYYFLTYNTDKEGLRYSNPNNTIPSSTINYVMTKSRLDFKEAYYPGEYILENMSLSEYINGEGYMSNLIGMGQSLSYNLNSSGFTNVPGITPSLSFYVAGRSNATASQHNHHFQLKHGNTILCDTTFRGYETIRSTKNIHINSETTTLNFNIVHNSAYATDFQAISYLEILYARNLNLSSSSSLKFTIPAQYVSSNLGFSATSINPILIDIKNNHRYDVIKNGSILNINNIYNNNSEFYLFDLNNAVTPIYQKITFRNFDISDIKQAIIISNKNLSLGAESYKNHNQLKRKLPTLLAYTEDLFNEFYYGFHHPLAINNFIKWNLDKGNNISTSLLLLGRGANTPRGNLTTDLVPTFGFPASDNMLGVFNNAKASSIAIGRIPAKTNEEINNYLKKLEIYENLPAEVWRKKIVNVTGGANNSEYLSFTAYLKNMSNVAANARIGAYSVNFDKKVSEAVTESLTDGIISHTNNGVSLINFLGHGSASMTAVSLGNTSNINNADKPTNYLVNGCSTGNAFSGATSYAENMILAENGAISWIGTTSDGVASYLYNYSNRFYSHWFSLNYEKSIAEGFRQAINDQTIFTDRLNLAHSRQYIFFGDPNIKFFNPTVPDLNINGDDVQMVRNQNAAQENFSFSFIAENIGERITEDVEVKITRKIAERNIEKVYFKTLKPIVNTDTFSFTFPNIDVNMQGAGINTLIIELDPANKITETNKFNNKVSQDFFLPGNGVNTIYPLKNSIAFGEVELTAQPDNLFTKNENYLFEIDTIATFDSHFKKTSPVIIADILPSWKPDILFEDQKTYYWRVTINNNEEPQWTTSAFTFSNATNYGQEINKTEQLANSNYTAHNINYNNSNKTFEFEKDLFSTTIFARGDDLVPGDYDRRIRTNPLNSIAWTNLVVQGITMASYSDVTKNKLVSYPSPYNATNGPNLINGYTGQFFWDLNNPVALDSMVRYINQLPEGHYVLGLTNNDCSLKNLPNHAKEALYSIGLNEFEKIEAGFPYAFWGRKGANRGEAIEILPDFDSPVPPREQHFSYTHELEYSVPSGYIITDKFGPAKKWKSAEISHETRPNSSLSVDVYTLDKNNNENLLFSNLNGTSVDLSSLSAEQYPYVKFKVNLTNPTEKSIQKINHWRVLYEPITEVTFNPSYLNDFHGEKVIQGDSLRLKLGISNISRFDSDSVKINIRLTNSNISPYTEELVLKPIHTLSNDTVEFKYPSIGLKGETNLQLSLRNKNHGDNYSFNNEIAYTINVETDNSAPNIDVLVDGRRIVSGEIVSPNPIFTISSTDENRFLLQADTSLVEIYMKSPLNNEYKRYYYSQGLVKIQQTGTTSNNSLMLQFTPEKLSNGTYSLKIVSKDYLGNKHTNDYLLDFEVINESTITNFYPYPNPVIDKMKFVFTLTGEKIPDKIKVQILNMSGRVVREIFKEELGNLKIGNNISDFTWDGTDMYGDRLAKGVYFYKIYLQDNSSEFKHRSSKGDTFFKNNIGKIYLIK